MLRKKYSEYKMKEIRSLTLLLVLSVCGLVAGETKPSESPYAEIVKNITGAKRPEKKAVSVTAFGAKGDGTSDCKPAFDKAMRKAKKQGGMHLRVPRGTYYIKGPIHLESNVWLELEEGSVLKFSPDPNHYPTVSTSWEGTFVMNHSPFIRGYEVENVTISGKGLIDGNAMTTFSTWRAKQEDDKQLSRQMNHRHTPVSERVFGKGHYLRPQLVQFYNCRGITIEGVSITNSPFWCIHLLRSDNIICRSLKYNAKLVNNDGIDPESSSNILIEDIDFDNGDDNVAIKSGRDDDGRQDGKASENIIIRKCRFKGLHGVVIGSEMSGGVRNVWVDSCTASGYCKRGIYIKTNPDRGGEIRNINVTNTRFEDVEDLYLATSQYAGEGKDSQHFTVIEGLKVDGLSCRKAKRGGLILDGTEAEPIRNAEFRNVTIEETPIGISFNRTEGIVLQDCNIGGRVESAPTMAK